MARALIAGCGYVGSALAARLAGDGHEVWGLRRRAIDPPAGVRSITADMSRPASLAGLPDGLDFVFYVAGADASTEQAYRAAYVDGLRNLLTALGPAGPARRLVLASSTAVYEQAGGETVDEASPTAPTRFQGRVLLESEAVARELAPAATAVRFGGIYGPTRTRMLDGLRAGTLRVSAAPQFTNRIHRDDCAGFLVHLVSLAEPAPLYVAVDDEPADRRRVLEWLAAEMGAAPPPVDESAAGPGSGKRASNERLHSTGYRLIYPSFREGYRAVLAGVGP